MPIYTILHNVTTKGFDRSKRESSQLEHELRVIHQSGLSNYFLIVWDIVRFARQGILCQGRGSGEFAGRLSARHLTD